MRSLDFAPGSGIRIIGSNRSTFYARYWLDKVGLDSNVSSVDSIVIVAGDDDSVPADPANGTTRIVLWDFQKGVRGTGLEAAAAAGVSWVIGNANGPPLAMPMYIPEKWCGLIGANMALATLVDAELRGRAESRRFDVSAADALRSFAEQNAGHASEVDLNWTRNGRIAHGHGGIFPQGFFPCRDGFVAIIGRSRRDWQAIRDVIGRPAWSIEPAYDDPYMLAREPGDAEARLAAALAPFDRDELMQKALENGATIAPVYAADELEARGVVRPNFFDADGIAKLPFEIRL